MNLLEADSTSWRRRESDVQNAGREDNARPTRRLRLPYSPERLFKEYRQPRDNRSEVIYGSAHRFLDTPRTLSGSIRSERDSRENRDSLQSKVVPDTGGVKGCCRRPMQVQTARVVVESSFARVAKVRSTGRYAMSAPRGPYRPRRESSREEHRHRCPFAQACLRGSVAEAGIRRR